MDFDFAHTAVAVITILVLLVAFLDCPGYSFPYGAGHSGGDRKYKPSPFDKEGNYIHTTAL